MSDTELEERDEQVAEALEAGRSLRSIRREFALTQSDLDAALERLWPIDHQARLRLIKRDVAKLDRLLQVFYTKGLQGDTNSAGIAVKIWERLHSLLAMDAAQRVDLTVTAPEAPQGFDQIREVLFKMKYGPDWRPGDGDGELPAPDDAKPNH